jgi:broad specificity phosphatase PhoE
VLANQIAARVGSQSPASPRVIFSSPEPKAQETAAILAKTWGLQVLVHPALHEHLRLDAPQDDQMDFHTAVAAVFGHPGEVVFGAESANQAEVRFSQAVDEICALETGNVCIVAHGTVISLFASRRCGVDAYTTWQQLGLPSVLAIRLPGCDRWQIGVEGG